MLQAESWMVTAKVSVKPRRARRLKGVGPEIPTCTAGLHRSCRNAMRGDHGCVEIDHVEPGISAAAHARRLAAARAATAPSAASSTVSLGLIPIDLVRHERTP